MPRVCAIVLLAGLPALLCSTPAHAQRRESLVWADHYEQAGDYFVGLTRPAEPATGGSAHIWLRSTTHFRAGGAPDSADFIVTIQGVSGSRLGSELVFVLDGGSPRVVPARSDARPGVAYVNLTGRIAVRDLQEVASSRSLRLRVGSVEAIFSMREIEALRALSGTLASPRRLRRVVEETRAELARRREEQRKGIR